MFLEMLNEEQKKLFMHLAIIAANANGYVEESENKMLLHFEKEMNIDPITQSNMKLDDVIDELYNICGELEKKIVLFEIVGILFSDENCDKEEMEFLDKIAGRFGFSNEQVKDMISLVEEYTKLYSQIFDTVIRDRSRVR